MEIEETNVNLEEIEIGKEQKQITAKTVLVTGFEIVEVNKEGKAVGKKLVLKVKHPDMENMELSKVKYESHSKLKESGLWVNIDNEGKLPHNSATACLMRHVGCNTIKNFVGKELGTTTDENGYLIAKTY